MFLLFRISGIEVFKKPRNETSLEHSLRIHNQQNCFENPRNFFTENKEEFLKKFMLNKYDKM